MFCKTVRVSHIHYSISQALITHKVTTTSFPATLCGQCCRRHVVGQQVIIDVSVVRGCWSLSLCSESTIHLLFTDVLGTSILVKIRVLGNRGIDADFSGVTVPLPKLYRRHGLHITLEMINFWCRSHSRERMVQNLHIFIRAIS